MTCPRLAFYVYHPTPLCASLHRNATRSLVKRPSVYSKDLTSGTSSPSAPYCAAIFLRFARLSGPSWLMMPGSRSWSFFVDEGPDTTYVFAAMLAFTVGLV